MYNIFVHFKLVRSSQAIQGNDIKINVEFVYKPLPSKSEPVDYDTPVPHKPLFYDF